MEARIGERAVARGGASRTLLATGFRSPRRTERKNRRAIARATCWSSSLGRGQP